MFAVSWFKRKRTMRYVPSVFIARVTILATIGLGMLQAQPAATSPDFFELKVRPVLVNNCYSCHAASAMGGLRLDSRDAMLKGGNRGPALVPGDPDNSLLIQAVRQTDHAENAHGRQARR